MIGIYIITNLIDGKQYIGQSVDIQRRFQEHRCISHESNVHLRNALLKYGKENFKYEVLEECLQSELDQKEVEYIKSIKPEYNVSSGGQNSLRKYPDSVKAVIREKSKAQWENMTDSEKRKRITNNLTGQGWNKGIPVSAEMKKRLRQANLGKHQSVETIEKRKATIKAKKENGYVQTNAGHRKRVVCVETGMIFNSVKETGEYFSVHPSSITGVLRGKYKTCNGYHFKYFEGVETIPDECKEVGQKMSCCSKCKAHK